MTGCASHKTWIPKEDVVEAVVREDVGEGVGEEEHRPSNVFRLYGRQNQ